MSGCTALGKPGKSHFYHGMMDRRNQRSCQHLLFFRAGAFASAQGIQNQDQMASAHRIFCHAIAGKTIQHEMKVAL
jgi:hypothetical protein